MYNTTGNRRSFSTTRSLRLDPASYTSLAFATHKTGVLFSSPFYMLVLGLSATIYIMLIRVSPDSNYSSSNPEHLANLVELAENLDYVLSQYLVESRDNIGALLNSTNFIGAFDDLRSHYDVLCQLYTSNCSIFDSFDIAYDILDDLHNYDADEYRDRLINVRNNIRSSCNEMLSLMRQIESNTIGYEFFTVRMPNFWLE
uniref:Uncharacterized protein n=2 Tax=Chrysoporthe TaxID=305399 RepID=A0A191MX09_9PEZI|nr:hypothetical protein [Chrysoporthe austroafricana]YP_009262141.1 hypothetical protein [Chrysoporthe cubensis]AMX22060.1 hypothetical protein [Chrysoporthe austroafricana]AMX22216.1 hypothetical protein [Chrysoporthe cubensis]